MTNEEAQNLIARNRSVFQYDPEMLEALDLAIKALEERPKGKWIKRGYIGCDTQFYWCSVCEYERSYDAETGLDDYNFCPNCGADMRSVDEGLHERVISDLSKTVDDLYKKLRGDV